MPIWPGRGNPRDNYSSKKDGEYTAVSTCPVCKTKYTGRSRRSQANAQSGATRQANACARRDDKKAE